MQAGKNITAKDIKDTNTEFHSYKCYGGNGVRGFVASYNRMEISQSSEDKEHFVETSILLKGNSMRQSMLLWWKDIVIQIYCGRIIR